MIRLSKAQDEIFGNPARFKVVVAGRRFGKTVRGVGLDALVLDEYADMAAEVWTEVLRPTLSDKAGEAFFLGTPKGHNWFHDLYMLGKTGEAGWQSWQHTTLEGGNVPPEEVEAAP